MSRVKQDEKEKSKQRILNSAIKLFAQKGYDGVGIREICKDANANICMISYFWGGKEGLYKGIIDNLVEKQTQIAKTFVDFEIEPNALNKNEQINLLFKIFDNMVDFMYCNEFSHHIIRVLISAQHERRVELTSPLLVYIRKLIANIFNKDINDKDVTYKFLFLIAQLNSALVMPVFSLGQLKKEHFDKNDMKTIKNNIKLYLNALINEVNKGTKYDKIY
ncbi:TetR/AcrR family transcriptional regulator [bacterium]|nr:TetR/AcrR family transcriptional regulator [bacterium]